MQNAHKRKIAMKIEKQTKANSIKIGAPKATKTSANFRWKMVNYDCTKHTNDAESERTKLTIRFIASGKLWNWYGGKLHWKKECKIFRIYKLFIIEHVIRLVCALQQIQRICARRPCVETCVFNAKTRDEKGEKSQWGVCREKPICFTSSKIAYGDK